jgi:tRNA(fMet)-specific endonuclease VapC
MSLYLIDTNILSEPIKPQPNDNVIAAMKLHADQLAISSVTWHEILFGCQRLSPSKKRDRIEEYLRDVRITFPILPYTTKAAEWQAAERSRLTAIGRTPAYIDSQIAAIAKVNNLTLVTNNTDDYRDFQDLKMENWFTS